MMTSRINWLRITFCGLILLLSSASNSFANDEKILTAEKRMELDDGVVFVADGQKAYGGTAWIVAVYTKDSEKKVANVCVVLRNDAGHVIFDGCIASRKSANVSYKKQYSFSLNESQLAGCEVSVTLVDKSGKYLSKRIALVNLSTREASPK